MRISGFSSRCTQRVRSGASTPWLILCLGLMTLLPACATSPRAFPEATNSLILPTVSGQIVAEAPAGAAFTPTPVQSTQVLTPTATFTPFPVQSTQAPSPTAEPSATPMPEPTPDPDMPPACTEIGQTWTSPRDGATLVCVPAGDFIMGTDTGYSDERPAHPVTLDAYWMDRSEVSNGQYALCVAAGVCTKPAQGGSSEYAVYYANPALADYPVIYINWYQSQVYCAWAGRSLPTEAQWEKAARGTLGWEYPWGNEFDGRRVNYADSSTDYEHTDHSINDGYAGTAPVGAFAQGASPYGALNMAGNVWEWVFDWYAPFTGERQVNPIGPASGEKHILHGGSWINEGADLRAAYRLDFDPSESAFTTGFRCAITLP